MTNVVSHNGRTIQGSSQFTARKEFEIGGLVQMRLRQLKGERPAAFYDRILIADVFSGSGENVLDAHSDPIDGSPLRLLDALNSAINTKQGLSLGALANKRIDFWFSDIRSEAIAHLNRVIADRGVRPEGINCGLATGTLAAASAMNLITMEMAENPRTHLILVLDPNGPKLFPRDESIALLQRFSNRVDLIPYISATAVNRCLQHRDLCEVNYDWWLSAIERFDTGFINAIAHKRAGWIREPMAGDKQKWLMLPTFTPKLVPHNDWNKQGYVEINSPRGQAAALVYSGMRGAA